MRFLWFGAASLLACAGCGLTLDLDPPDDGGALGFDARPRADSGSRDAGSRDGGPPAECATDDDCDDADVCDGREACVAGRCVEGTPLACEDGIDCTVDACDPVEGCRRTLDDARCAADAVACTTERCVEGSGCLAQPDHAACADAVRCTDDVCDPLAGCRHVPRNDRCPAGGACDPSGGCDGLACESDADCDDVPLGPCETALTCREGRCAPVLRPDGRACDDANPCTDDDRCAAGVCNGDAVTVCPGEPCWRCNPLGGGCDGSLLRSGPCDDGDRCTQGGACSPGGRCVSTLTTACLAPECRNAACDPASGACVPTSPDPEGAACSDRDPCTATSACDGAGHCSVTTPFCRPSPDPCVSRTCTLVLGAPTCVPSTQICAGVNEMCAPGGGCACTPGFEDCDGLPGCECPLGTRYCARSALGVRTCQRYTDCASVRCEGAATCCPCGGACCAPTDTACCAGCPLAPRAGRP